MTIQLKPGFITLSLEKVCTMQLKSHLSPFPFVDAECCSDWRILHNAALTSDIPASEFSLVRPMNSTNREGYI